MTLMKRSTIRSLLAITVLLDLALLGVLLYDYFQNESDWMLYVLVAFAVFLVIALVLFMLAGRGSDTRVVEKVVIKEIERESDEFEPMPRREVEERVVFQEIRPIPPAPIQALRENPPRRISTPPRPVASGIPFVFNGYTLFTREVMLKNGGKRPIYFFSKKKPKSGRMCAKPLGYHVGVNERTGLPFLKKGSGPDGEDLTPAAAESEYRPQCSAITEDGAQCRNSARGGSKYCGSHFGYQPKTLKGSAKHIEGEEWSDDDDQTDSSTVREADTRARVKGAPDTKPSLRRLFSRRKKSAS